MIFEFDFDRFDGFIKIHFSTLPKVNKRDTQGWTPCMYAASEGKYEALKFLVDNVGAKVTKCTKRERMNLLHLGVQSGDLDVVQYLLIRMGTSYLKV